MEEGDLRSDREEHVRVGFLVVLALSQATHLHKLRRRATWIDDNNEVGHLGVEPFVDRFAGDQRCEILASKIVIVQRFAIFGVHTVRPVAELRWQRFVASAKAAETPTERRASLPRMHNSVPGM